MPYTYQSQQRHNWCGIACLSMVYARYGITKSQEDIYCDMVKANILCGDGGTNMASLINHINKNSVLFACSVKPENLESFFLFANEKNLSLIMACRARFDDTFHSMVYDQMEDGLIHGFDPGNEDIFPVSLIDIKEMFKSIHKSHITVVTDDVGFFKEHKATRGHYFIIPAVPADIADFVLCPTCMTWRRMSKMTSADKEGLITYKFGGRIFKELNERLSGKQNYENAVYFMIAVIKKIEAIRAEVQKESGVLPPRIDMDEDKALPDNEFSVHVKGHCAEQFRIDLETATLQEIEDKIIETYQKWTKG